MVASAAFRLLLAASRKALRPTSKTPRFVFPSIWKMGLYEVMPYSLLVSSSLNQVLGNSCS
jgi:hypothetical protein